MAATILGGAVFQWPVGHLSDRHDRRRVLFLVCCASAAVAIAGFFLAREYEGMLIGMGGIYGGLSFTIYGLSVAHVNDLIDPRGAGSDRGTAAAVRHRGEVGPMWRRHGLDAPKP